MDDIDRARCKWNAEADEYNQWDALGQDEKDELIKKESKYNLPEGYIHELGCTVRTCVDCGCLVVGGVTRCNRCVRDIEKQNALNNGCKEDNLLNSINILGETLNKLFSELDGVIKSHRTEYDNHEAYFRGVRIGLETAINIIRDVCGKNCFKSIVEETNCDKDLKNYFIEERRYIMEEIR